MKRRVIKVALLTCALIFVVALGAVFFYCRSLGSERNTPIECRKLITADASCALLLKWDLADDGVRELSAPLIDAHDKARENAAGRWERLAYFLLGFGRPSDVITRPLPAEGVLVVRYDEQAKKFHSHVACSVSGLAGLLAKSARRLPSLAHNPGVTYDERAYRGETLLVAKNGAGPPQPSLNPQDVTAIFAPLTPPGGCWSVVDNNIILARRPDSIAFVVDQLKTGDAAGDSGPPIAKLIPKMTDGIDAAGALVNKRGEFACLIELAASVMDSRILKLWLKSKRVDAREDLKTLTTLTLAADVQPGDRIVATFGVRFSDLGTLQRVIAVLGAALREFEPPPPIKFTMVPDIGMNGVEVRVTVTGVGEYLRRRAAAKTNIRN
ncbi:MAG: hypothetical protein ABIF82_15155 [Planctomycetota bacterium]